MSSFAELQLRERHRWYPGSVRRLLCDDDRRIPRTRPRPRCAERHQELRQTTSTTSNHRPEHGVHVTDRRTWPEAAATAALQLAPGLTRALAVARTSHTNAVGAFIKRQSQLFSKVCVSQWRQSTRPLPEFAVAGRLNVHVHDGRSMLFQRRLRISGAPTEVGLTVLHTYTVLSTWI